MAGQLGALAEEVKKKREADAAAVAGRPTGSDTPAVDPSKRKAAVDGFSSTPTYKMVGEGKPKAMKSAEETLMEKRLAEAQKAGEKAATGKK
jgi:hypothetical protein